jgi:hypothetical protein
VSGRAGHGVEELLHRGADALLARPPARRRGEGLCGAGEVEEVRALGVVQPQRSGDRVEDALRCPGELAALQAGVVRNAHAGEDRDLLAAQPRDAPGPIVREPDIGGLEPRPPGGEELADLVARVHRRVSVDARIRAWVALPGSPSQGLPHGVRACFRGQGVTEMSTFRSTEGGDA